MYMVRQLHALSSIFPQRITPLRAVDRLSEYRAGLDKQQRLLTLLSNQGKHPLLEHEDANPCAEDRMARVLAG